VVEVVRADAGAPHLLANFLAASRNICSS
jgi:hypothetical protein